MVETALRAVDLGLLLEGNALLSEIIGDREQDLHHVQEPHLEDILRAEMMIGEPDHLRGEMRGQLNLND